MDYTNKGECLIQVSRTEDGLPRNVRTESDGKLPLPTLTSHFACASGLIYKVKSKEFFTVDKCGKYLLPPQGGWVTGGVYFPVFGFCKTTTPMTSDVDMLGENQNTIADLFHKFCEYFDNNIAVNDDKYVLGSVQGNLIKCLQEQLVALHNMGTHMGTQNEPLTSESDVIMTSESDVKSLTSESDVKSESDDIIINGGGNHPDNNKPIYTISDTSEICDEIYDSISEVDDADFESSESEYDAERRSSMSFTVKSSWGAQDTNILGNAPGDKYRNRPLRELYISVRHQGVDKDIIKYLNSNVEFCNIIQNKYNAMLTQAHVKFKSRKAERKALKRIHELNGVTAEYQLPKLKRKFWQKNFRVDGISPQTSMMDICNYFSKYAQVVDKFIPKSSQGYGLVRLRFSDVDHLVSTLHGTHFICDCLVDLVPVSRLKYNAIKQGRTEIQVSEVSEVSNL